MCGIAVHLAAPGRPVADDVLRRLSSLQAHRGPDDSGCMVLDPVRGEHYREDADGRRRPVARLRSTRVPAGVGLAARRLAIVDRSEAGHQPMLDSEDNCAVVLNGEIYNYVELRTELGGLGHTFVSRSDTEVLLAAYKEWGTDCLAHLVGMFAFVIVDRGRARVLLARDPFGMKPLFYAPYDGGWVFASEIGALLEATGVPRQADPQRVSEYLDTALTSSGDATVFQHVRQVPAASTVEWSLHDAVGIEPRKYWAPSISDELHLSFGSATGLVRDAFLRSVELHLRGDGPIGVILSGGTDSSSVTLALREAGGSNLDIHTFSYIGEQGAPSEERWIDDVNRAAKTIPHKLKMRPSEWSANERRAYHQGAPSASLAVYAQNRLYELAAGAGVRIALSGQGGDEVFAGYDRHRVNRLVSLLASGQLGSAAAFARDSGRAEGSGGRRRLLVRALASGAPREVRRLARRSLRRSSSVSPDYRTKHQLSRSVRKSETRRRALRANLRQGLGRGLPTLLRYEDRSSMQHSVEGRLPFLTTELVELALALPEDHLVAADGRCKHVFTEAMRGLVPDSVLDRKDKIGFAVPARTWPLHNTSVAPILEASGSLPPVSEALATRLSTELLAGEPLARTDAFAIWRLVGLQDWADDLDVDFA